MAGSMGLNFLAFCSSRVANFLAKAWTGSVTSGKGLPPKTAARTDSASCPWKLFHKSASSAGMTGFSAEGFLAGLLL